MEIKRFLAESEINRILNMHNTYKSIHKTWVIKEAYSGEKNKGYDSLDTCKKDSPFNVVVKAGLKWNDVKAKWGSTGTAKENLALRDAFCNGWRPGDDKDPNAAAPPVSSIATPADPTKVTQQISDWFKTNIGSKVGEINPENFKMIGDKMTYEFTDTDGSKLYFTQDGTISVVGKDGVEKPNLKSTWSTGTVPEFPSAVSASGDTAAKAGETQTGDTAAKDGGTQSVEVDTEVGI